MSRGLATFAALQVGWFASVLGGAAGRPWLGPAVVALFVAVHLAFAENRRHETATLVGFGLAGSAADSLWSATGLLAFAGAAGAPLCPPWIAGLWIHFATTLRGALAPLARRPLVAAALGAIAAPVSYVAGARLGAVVFHPATWPSLLAVGLAWAALLPLALHLANRGSRPPSRRGPGARVLSHDAVPVPVPVRIDTARRGR